MRGALFVFILAILFHHSAAAPQNFTYSYTSVALGYTDDGFGLTVNTDSYYTILDILENTAFINPYPLNLTDSAAVSAILPDVDVLILCPGFVNITTNNTAIVNFVNKGGTLIFTSGMGDNRAKQVSEWFSYPALNVETYYPYYDIDYYYYYSNQYYYSPFDGVFKGKPLDESLRTTFGRIMGNHWGLPFKQIPPNLYYVNGSTYLMEENASNDAHCLFRSFNGVCWIFDFQVGNGHIIALPFTFDTNMNFGSSRAAAVLAAACGTVLEQKVFPKTGIPIMVQEFRDLTELLSYDDWADLIFEVGLYGDPYVFRTVPQFDTMQAYLNPSVVVLNHLKGVLGAPPAKKMQSRVVEYPTYYGGYYYYNFIQAGGNIAFWGNNYDAAMLLRLYLDPYSAVAPIDYSYYSNIQIYNPLYGSFSYLPSVLPYMNGNHSPLVFNNTECLFATMPSGECHVWKTTLGPNDGNFTFLSWHFDRPYDYDTLYVKNRYSFSWPNPVWRSVLRASLDPAGPPAEVVNQRFDLDYFKKYSKYSPVGMLMEAPLSSEVVNLYMFLNYSGHPVHRLDYRINYGDLANILNDTTAFIIPEKISPVGPYLVSMLQSFMNNGSQVILLGDNVDLLNALAATSFSPSYIYDYYVRSILLPAFYPLGYDLYSQESNGLFGYYFRENRTLPAWEWRYVYPLDYSAQLKRNTYLDDYCAYGFDGYCALWSKTYGSNPENGDLTFMGTTFHDNGAGGAKSSFVNAAPWVRALNIAIEGKPAVASPSPSSSPTPPSPSAPPSPPASPSSPPSPPASPSAPPSPPASPSSPPSPSPTPSTPPPTSSLTSSPGASPSMSSSTSMSLSDSPTPTSTVSETSSRSAIPAGPEDIPSVAPASPSSSASRKPPVVFTPTPSVPQINLPDTEDCQDCDIGSVVVATNPSEGADEPTVVDITLPGGELIGTVVIPPTFISSGYVAMDITFVTNLPQRGNIERGNTILDINLYDEFGNSIHELPDPLEICIAEEADEDDACLGYYDVTNREWICEDECLKRENDSYCGETDHLTNFAVLLGGSGGGRSGGDPCESYSPNYLFAWLSLAAVALACCCIIVGILAVEMKMRKKQYNHHRSFRNMSRTVQKNM